MAKPLSIKSTHIAAPVASPILAGRQVLIGAAQVEQAPYNYQPYLTAVLDAGQPIPMGFNDADSVFLQRYRLLDPQNIFEMATFETPANMTGFGVSLSDFGIAIPGVHLNFRRGNLKLNEWVDVNAFMPIEQGVAGYANPKISCPQMTSFYNAPDEYIGVVGAYLIWELEWVHTLPMVTN